MHCTTKHLQTSVRLGKFKIILLGILSGSFGSPALRDPPKSFCLLPAVQEKEKKVKKKIMETANIVYERDFVDHELESSTVRFTLFGKGAAALKRHQFLSTLEGRLMDLGCESKEVLSMWKGESPFDSFVSFKERMTRNLVKDKLSHFKIGSISVIAAEPYDVIKEVRVHWVPAFVKNDLFVRYFEAREFVVLAHDVEMDPYDKIGNGVRTFRMKAQKCTWEDLPHVVDFYQYGFKTLFKVPGREPLCLKCKEIGHQRADCPKESYPRGPSDRSRGPSDRTREKQPSSWQLNLAQETRSLAVHQKLPQDDWRTVSYKKKKTMGPQPLQLPRDQPRSLPPPPPPPEPTVFWPSPLANDWDMDDMAKAETTELPASPLEVSASSLELPPPPADPVSECLQSDSDSPHSPLDAWQLLLPKDATWHEQQQDDMDQDASRKRKWEEASVLDPVSGELSSPAPSPAPPPSVVSPSDASSASAPPTTDASSASAPPAIDASSASAPPAPPPKAPPVPPPKAPPEAPPEVLDLRPPKPEVPPKPK
jgi:hypothetical protein